MRPTALVLASFCTLMSTAPHALAQAADPTARVTITGSPIVEAQRVDAFGSLSTEVSGSQLRDLNAMDLSSALRRTPGVQVSRFNPVGSFGGDEGGAVFVRGLGASRPGSEIKTYVDGLPFYTGVWNHALLDLLPVHGMARITVHKGPQPQAFGNTFAAIDLEPRRAGRDGLSGDLRIAAGSHSTVIEQASLAWRSSAAEFSLAQVHAESDGHRPSADGRLDSGLLRGSLALGPDWRIGAMLLGADNRVSDPGIEGNPASRTGRFDTRGSLRSLSLEHQHAFAEGRLQLYGASGTGLWADPTAGVTRSRFALSGLRWREHARPWAGGQLTAGLDIDRMSGSVAFGPFTAFDHTSLRLTSPYVGVAHTVALAGGWTVTPSGGIRLVRHNVFGHDESPHVGMVLAQGEALSLRLNATRGLNFPGLDAALLNAIVPPLAGAPTSWKSLRPEQMDHLELGARWVPGRGSAVDVALFNDRLSQRYVFAFPPAVPLPSFTNLGSYRMRGVESSWQQHWNAAWSSFAGLTLLSPTLDDLPYAPRRALALGLTWQQGPWRVSADAQAQAGMAVLNKARADGAPNPARVGGFAVANLRASMALPALGPHGEAFVALENLADRRYAYRPGYPMPGRSGQVGLQVGL